MNFNPYSLTDEIKIRFLPVVKNFIYNSNKANPKELSYSDYEELTSMCMTGWGINPYQLRTLITDELGFDDVSVEKNGFDFCIEFEKDEIRLCIDVEGEVFGLVLNNISYD